MRYLYKIYSPYDGFYPARLPDRLRDGRFLELGWQRYLDALNKGDEVWIVFTGKGVQAGVYVEGLVDSIDRDAGTAQLRVRRSSTRAPLTDAATSARLREAVATRNRQVFLWPPDWALRERCHADECGRRACLACDVWRGMPQIEAGHYRPPGALAGIVVAPAYWIIPARCYLYYGARQPNPWIRRTTEMFAAFKVGEKRYAFPFAAGMARALEARGEGGFDAIIPIPLSPEKAQANEIDRTGLLAGELARLTGWRARSLLRLTAPISKRRMILQGYSATVFKARYRQLLEVDPAVAELRRVLLIDDVITRGSTLSASIAELRAINPRLEIVVSAAGQMVLKDAVADQNGPAW